MKKIPLAIKILIGMLSGVLLGILLSIFKGPENVSGFLGISLFHLGGTIFLNMFRMVVVPIVLFSMIRGVTTMNNPSLLGRVGLKTLVVFLLTTLAAAVLGIGSAKIFHLGENASIELPAAKEVTDVQAQSIMETLSEIVPKNLFESIVDGNMLQVIFIAVIIGLALILVKDKNKNILLLLEEIDAVNIKIVELTLAIAPIGVFCLMTETFGNFGLHALYPLFAYVVCVVLTIAIMIFGIYSLLLWLLAGLSPLKFFRKYAPVMLFAFSSSSSNATLPMNIDTTTHKLGVEKSLSTFILSLGATINMNGTAIMQCCAAVFIANLYHVNLTIAQLCQIIVVCIISSIGTAGMPGAGVIMLGLVLQTVGIPIEGTAIILGVDRIIDMFRTTANITGDAITAVLVASSEKHFEKDIFNKN